MTVQLLMTSGKERFSDAISALNDAKITYSVLIRSFYPRIASKYNENALLYYIYVPQKNISAAKQIVK